MPIRRQFDNDAMHAICEAANARGSVEFELPTREDAMRFRAQFYSWRKLQQAINSTSPADNLTCRIRGSWVVISCHDNLLRSALETAGIQVKPVFGLPARHIQQPQLDPPSPSQPPGKEMKDLIKKLYMRDDDAETPDNQE